MPYLNESWGSATVYCPKCGTPVGDELAYCPACAASLALPGEAGLRVAAQRESEREEAARESRARTSRAGLLCGVVFAVMGAGSMILAAVDDPVSDSDTAYGLGVIAFFFVLLIWCAGYLSRKSGFGYAAGVGFGLVFAPGSLVCMAISASRGDDVGTWLWGFEAVGFGVCALGFRGLLWLRSERRKKDASVGQATSAGEGSGSSLKSSFDRAVAWLVAT